MLFRILKMIATSGFLTALECNKFVFGRGPYKYDAGDYGAPKTLAGYKRTYFYKGNGQAEEEEGDIVKFCILSPCRKAGQHQTNAISSSCHLHFWSC